jgi:hypothetical protein
MSTQTKTTMGKFDRSQSLRDLGATSPRDTRGRRMRTNPIPVSSQKSGRRRLTDSRRLQSSGMGAIKRSNKAGSSDITLTDRLSSSPSSLTPETSRGKIQPEGLNSNTSSAGLATRKERPPGKTGNASSPWRDRYSRSPKVTPARRQRPSTNKLSAPMPLS